jgi:hypothetical protein
MWHIDGTGCMARGRHVQANLLGTCRMHHINFDLGEHPHWYAAEVQIIQALCGVPQSKGIVKVHVQV